MKKCFVLLLFCLLFFSGCQNNSLDTNLERIAVNDIVINKSHAYVDEGSKIILLAQVFPFNADNQNISWRSDNSNVAKVEDGIVFGVKEGRTVITATSEDGNISANCVVYVSTPKLNYKDYNNNIKKQNYEIQKNEEINNLKETKTKNLEEIEVNLDKKLEDIENLSFNMFDFIQEKIDSIHQEYYEIFNFVNENFSLNGKNRLINLEDNKNYNYHFEFKYSNQGINEEVDEDTIYKDENTIIKEKLVDFKIKKPHNCGFFEFLE